MSIPVLLPAEVEAQIRLIDSWWRANRTAAPGLFAEELAAALEILGGAPLVGRRYAHPDVPEVRRILLRSTRYHLYYKLQEGAVILLSAWSAVRGAGPDLTGSVQKSGK